jgi:hypothetical protein
MLRGAAVAVLVLGMAVSALVARAWQERIPSSSTLGADARVDPGVLATLDQARDSGKATLSNQTTLAGDLDLPAPERPVAFELSVPVYRHELPRTPRPASGGGPWSAGRPGSSASRTSSTRP